MGAATMAMEQEAAALRAKIQAMKNLLQTKQQHHQHQQQRYGGHCRPVAHTSGGYKARFARAVPGSRMFKSHSWPTHHSASPGISTNRVWKNENAVPLAKKPVPAAVAPKPVYSLKRTRKVSAASSGSSSVVRRALDRMQLKVVKLEDGEYAKANGGFSLVRSGVPIQKPATAATIKAPASLLTAYRSAHSTTKAPANSAVQRANAVMKRARLLKSKAKAVKVRTELCLFYNRFGYCKNKNDCKYIHDSRKVAICRNLLRDGSCDDAKCLLSHKFDQNKMPVCTLFLRGACTRDDCKYRHVKVSQGAQVCQAFLKGYCPQGAACKLKHELPSKKKRTSQLSTSSAASGKSGAGPVEASPPVPSPGTSATASTSVSAAPSTDKLSIRPNIRAPAPGRGSLSFLASLRKTSAV